MKSFKLFSFVLCTYCLATGIHAQRETTCRVVKTPRLANDSAGFSCVNATPLHVALSASASGNTIWVKIGSYKNQLANFSQHQ